MIVEMVSAFKWGVLDSQILVQILDLPVIAVSPRKQ